MQWVLSRRFVLSFLINSCFFLAFAPKLCALEVGSLPGSFEVTPQGSAQYTLPLQLPPANAGPQPDIALSYNSLSHNAELGVGWSLQGLSTISRCPERLEVEGYTGSVDFDAKDHYCFNGHYMISTGPDTYQLETNHSVLIRSAGNMGEGPNTFTLYHPEGTITTFGGPGAHQKRPNSQDVFIYYPVEQADRYGNAITYRYNSEFRLSQIQYNSGHIQFEYEARPDSSVAYLPGEIPAKLHERLKHIQVQNHQGQPLWTYALTYRQDHFSLLSAIQLCHPTDCFPATTFEWQTRDGTSIHQTQTGTWPSSAERYYPGDFNGDGKMDYYIIDANQGWRLYHSNGSGIVEVNRGSWPSTEEIIHTGDFDANGRTDLLVNPQAGGWTMYHTNADGTDLHEVGSGSWPSTGETYYPGHFNSDGKTDFFIIDANSGWHLYHTNAASNGIQQVGSGSWPSTAEKVYLGDYTGDGRTDIYIISGADDGWKLYETTQDGTDLTLLSEGTWPNTQEQIYPGDYNGDGKTDIMAIAAEGGWSIYHSTGNNLILAGQGNWPSTGEQYYSSDLNADGRTDLLVLPQAGGWHLYQTGAEGDRLALKATGDLPENAEQYYLGDMTGNGQSDVLMIIKEGGWRFFESSVSGQGYVIKSIHDGLGNMTHIEYQYLTHPDIYTPITATYPDIALHTSQLVVSRVKTDNGLGGYHELTYEYTGKLARVGRGALGFSQIKVTDPVTNTETLTTYSQDADHHTLGMPLKHITRINGITLSRTLYQYETRQHKGLYLTYPKITTAVSLDLDHSVIRVSTTEHTYHPTDWVLTQSTTCVADSAVDLNDTVIPCSALDVIHTRQLTYSHYPAGTIAHHISPPVRRQTTTQSTATHTHSQTIEFDYDPQTGQRIQTIRQPEHPKEALTTQIQYDPHWGHITQTHIHATDIGTRSHHIQYDSQGRIRQRINPLGHTETLLYEDARFPWLVTRTRDPNGLETHITYDDWGRAINTTRPDGTSTHTQHHACHGCDGVTRATHKTRLQHTGKPDITTYFDSLGRRIATHTLGFEDNTTRAIWVQTAYNARGHIARVSAPYFQGDTPYWTETQYDVLDRPVRVQQPDGRESRIQYQGQTRHFTNALNQTKIETRNALDQIIQTQDASGVMQYTYDAQGKLISTRDPDNHLIQITYDHLGRKTHLQDPDQGTWTYTYYADGTLKTQTDAKGQTTTHDYDALGRMIRRTDPDQTESTWTYDTCPHGIGKLCQMSSPGHRETYQYDPLGRIQSTLTTLDQNTFVTQQTYDAFSRVKTQSLPGGLKLENEYHTLGMLHTISNADTQQTYWQIQTMNARGQMEGYQLGGHINISRYHDPTVGRVQAIQAWVLGSNLVELDYQWDALGNLIQRTDHQLNLHETFAYDELNRLTDTWITGASTDHQQVAYDQLGNITYKTGLGHYHYGQTRCGQTAGPHAVTQVEAHGAYRYDANGNLTSGNGRQIQYTPFNKPRLISQSGEGQTRFFYNANRKRYKRIDDARTTYYVGAYEQIQASGRTTHRYHIAHSVVIETTGHETQTHYQLTDHQGTLVALVSETGQVVERMSYDAWGQRRLTKGQIYSQNLQHLASELTTRGYTQHEHIDRMGLIHMNGRVFDPVIGRFLSADPIIQSPSNSQSYNRYSYTINNPLKYTDPSGYSWLSREWKRTKRSWRKRRHDLVGKIAFGMFGHSSTVRNIGTALGCMIGGPAVCASAVSANAYASGASTEAALKSGASGYVGAYVGGQIAGYTGGTYDAGTWQNILGNGLGGGTQSAINGGSFQNGFTGGAFGVAFKPLGFDLFPNANQTWHRVAFAGLVGGTGAYISGGSFGYGAFYGGFGQYWNGENTVRYKGADGNIYTVRVRQSTEGMIAEGSGATDIHDYNDLTQQEVANAAALSAALTAPYYVISTPLAIVSAFLDPSPGNLLGAALGPVGKGVGFADDALFYGDKVLEGVINNANYLNNMYGTGKIILREPEYAR